MKPEDWTLFGRGRRDPDPPAMSTPALCAVAVGFALATAFAAWVLG